MNESNTIKIAAVTGGIRTPSARFRFRQYIDRLAAMGIDVREHLPFFEKSCGWPSPFKAAARIPALIRSRRADLVWLNKELVQGYPTFERLLKRPRVLDVDDAVWLAPPLGKAAAPYIAKAMDAVIVGNSYLANYFDRYCTSVYIVPTAVDLTRYTPKPAQSKNGSRRFTIGWTGLAYNYKYLNDVAATLNTFLQKTPEAELLIVANKPWNTKQIDPGRIRFVQWSAENEAAVLHQMSVGIMPLADDKWTRGKCSFKMLQYMAAGLSVIASPVGMNRDVFQKGSIGVAAKSPDEWLSALHTLHTDTDLRSEMGKAGRAVVEQYYNADKIADELAQIFKSLV